MRPLTLSENHLRERYPHSAAWPSTLPSSGAQPLQGPPLLLGPRGPTLLHQALCRHAPARAPPSFLHGPLAPHDLPIAAPPQPCRRPLTLPAASRCSAQGIHAPRSGLRVRVP
ncbi:hypothetical protein NDU88_007393 [Pleurodeles waltl]|uniref:Uncharacterized protein n=1 Tax=Pleurodeles waltl TaxID=8319 RepID=A0AAV7U259_PLEWA|nr:hypothetical protein NDU88_007393 [Pleurodeles waltl]